MEGAQPRCTHRAGRRETVASDVLARVKVEGARLHADLPAQLELIASRVSQRGTAHRQLHRGRRHRQGPKELGDALHQAEMVAHALREEIRAFEATATALFEPPPIEWIEELT